MHLTTEEKQTLLACINIAIKSSQNSLQAAADLLPLAQKLSAPEPPIGSE